MKFSVVLPLLVLGTAGNMSIAAAQSPGTFTATGSMTTPRVNHSAALLADGRVLITSGRSLKSKLSPPHRQRGIFAYIRSLTALTVVVVAEREHPERTLRGNVPQ